MVTHDTRALIGMIFMSMLAACTTSAPTGKSTATTEQSAARASDDAASSLRRSAIQQLEQGHMEMASSHLERSLRIKPDSAESYFQLARVRVAQGLLTEAKHLASKALSLIDSQGLVQSDILTGLKKLMQRIAQLEQQ